MREAVAGALDGARRRSLRLLQPVPDDDLVRQHSPLMSPLVWDLAHVGNYEEQWLLGAVAGVRAAAHLDPLYDAFRHPRGTRSSLALLEPGEARAYVADVRARVLDCLAGVELDPEVALLRDRKSVV